MPIKNHYDVLVISDVLQKDIQARRRMTMLSAIAFMVLLLLLVPLAMWLFFAAFLRADMPFFDLDVIGMFSATRFFLLPYSIILVYYFAVMYFKDTSIHLVNKSHFKKAIRFFLFSVLTALSPFFLGDHFVLTVIYFMFFIATVYYLSMTHYDVAFSKAYSIHSHMYRDDDLGWLGGYIDNPFSIKDDINRTKFMVQTSTLGFDFVAIFIETIVSSLVFVYAIRYKQYVREAARLFDYLLEQKLEIDIHTFSYQSKIILESVNYLSFRDGEIALLERGEEVARLARIDQR